MSLDETVAVFASPVHQCSTCLATRFVACLGPSLSLGERRFAAATVGWLSGRQQRTASWNRARAQRTEQGRHEGSRTPRAAPQPLAALPSFPVATPPTLPHVSQSLTSLPGPAGCPRRPFGWLGTAGQGQCVWTYDRASRPSSTTTHDATLDASGARTGMHRARTLARNSTLTRPLPRHVCKQISHGSAPRPARRLPPVGTRATRADVFRNGDTCQEHNYMRYNTRQRQLRTPYLGGESPSHSSWGN